MEINAQNIIQSEREKLNRMIDDSLNNRVPLSKNDEIQQQGKFLEQLIDMTSKDKEAR